MFDVGTALIQGHNLRFIDIETDHRRTRKGKLTSQRESHVAHPNNCDFRFHSKDSQGTRCNPVAENIKNQNSTIIIRQSVRGRSFRNLFRISNFRAPKDGARSGAIHRSKLPLEAIIIPVAHRQLRWQGGLLIQIQALHSGLTLRH